MKSALSAPALTAAALVKVILPPGSNVSPCTWEIPRPVYVSAHIPSWHDRRTRTLNGNKPESSDSNPSARFLSSRLPKSTSQNSQRKRAAGLSNDKHAAQDVPTFAKRAAQEPPFQCKSMSQESLTNGKRTAWAQFSGPT